MENSNLLKGTKIAVPNTNLCIHRMLETSCVYIRKGILQLHHQEAQNPTQA